jgi:hypothetical protein
MLAEPRIFLFPEPKLPAQRLGALDKGHLNGGRILPGRLNLLLRKNQLLTLSVPREMATT